MKLGHLCRAYPIGPFFPLPFLFYNLFSENSFIGPDIRMDRIGMGSLEIFQKVSEMQNTFQSESKILEFTKFIPIPIFRNFQNFWKILETYFFINFFLDFQNFLEYFRIFGILKQILLVVHIKSTENLLVF